MKAKKTNNGNGEQRSSAGMKGGHATWGESCKSYEWLSSFFSNPGHVLLLTFLLGISLAVISILFSGFIYRDAVLYTKLANAFGIGDSSRAFMDDIPPLFPFIGGILCKLGIPAIYSTFIVGSVFCVLTIFPLYFLLCYFIEAKYAAWGALFYLLAPKVLRFGFASVIEGARFFFFILPVWLMFSYVQSVNKTVLITPNPQFLHVEDAAPSPLIMSFVRSPIHKLIGLGISLALLALVRGEGIVSAPFILLCIFLLCLKNNRYKVSLKFICRYIIHSIIIIVVMTAVLYPRLYQVHKHTGYYAIDMREVRCLQEYSTIIFGKPK